MSQENDPAREEIHSALLESENRYRKVFDSINDGIIIHDAAGNIVDVNQTMYERLGYSKDEMLRMTLQDLVSPEFGKKIAPRTKRLEEQGVAIFESADKRKDGTYMPVEVSTRFVDYKGKKLIQSVVRDIQERKMAEGLITANIMEKEALLGEIQTRAKFDNLVFTLILEHLAKMESPDILMTVIENQRKRLQTLRYLQDKIYQHPNVLRINFSQVIRNLTRYVYNLYLQKGKAIDIKLAIEDAYFDLPTCMTCAQIISELLSNALLHAFRGYEQGVVELKFHGKQNGKQTIAVRDNGRGFPEELDFRSSETTGLKLINLLVEQISGTIRLERNHGTTFELDFQIK